MFSITPAPAGGRTGRVLTAAVLPVAIAAFVLPAAAQAAVIEEATFDTLRYRADSGETNTLTVSSLNGGVEVRDLAGLTSRTPLCAQVSSVTVRCAIGMRLSDVRLGDRDDRFAIGVSAPVVVDAGSGRDSYIAASAADASRVDYRGGANQDRVSYSQADRSVKISDDGVANDGRFLFDRDNIRPDVENLDGSRFGDEITGATDGSILDGLQGDDILRTGPGDSFVVSSGSAADGADAIIGGTGFSTVNYIGRTRPVNVTLNHGGADDGEPGERDQIFGSIERVNGGQAGDTIRAEPGSTAAHILIGFGGDDTVEGADGPDRLHGAEGRDTLLGNRGNDRLFANDGFGDIVGCGLGTDTAELDSLDGFSGCENRTVGVLRLSPKALRTKVGEPARLELSWRHPRSWRNLRRLELRLVHDQVPVGSVAIRPRGRRIRARGAVRFVRRASRITRGGKTVRARLALRLDRSLAGRRLRLEVEAVDAGGARQLESRAGSIRVAA